MGRHLTQNSFHLGISSDFIDWKNYRSVDPRRHNTHLLQFLGAAVSETGNISVQASKVSATSRGRLGYCQPPISNDRPSLLPLSRDDWQNLQEKLFPFVLREILAFCGICCVYRVSGGSPFSPSLDLSGSSLRITAFLWRLGQRRRHWHFYFLMCK